MLTIIFVWIECDVFVFSFAISAFLLSCGVFSTVSPFSTTYKPVNQPCRRATVKLKNTGSPIIIFFEPCKNAILLENLYSLDTLWYLYRGPLMFFCYWSTDSILLWHRSVWGRISFLAPPWFFPYLNIWPLKWITHALPSGKCGWLFKSCDWDVVTVTVSITWLKKLLHIPPWRLPLHHRNTLNVKKLDPVTKNSCISKE